MIGIYKIENLINNKIYIGQSIDIERRLKEHQVLPFYQSERIKDNKNPLYLDIRIYGLKNFSFNIIKECSTAQLDEEEIALIIIIVLLGGLTVMVIIVLLAVEGQEK